MVGSVVGYQDFDDIKWPVVDWGGGLVCSEFTPDLTDYEEGDQYDWDRNDDNQRCKHGTFIGSWWGPDVLCGACEFGDD